MRRSAALDDAFDRALERLRVVIGLDAVLGDRRRRVIGRDYDRGMEFETRAIHVGQEPDPATGAVITPIYQTSTFAQEAVGVNKGYDYARVGEPDPHGARGVPRLARERRTRARLRIGCRRDLDDHAPARPGRPRRLRERRLRRHVPHVLPGLRAEGLSLHYATPEQLSAEPEAHIAERTRLVWIETPTNPLLNVVDIEAVAAATKAAGALLVVDSTFATPFLQKPLDLGADIVLHSTTKYLGGHSDVVGGFAGTNDPTIAERLRFLQKSLGAVPGPFDSWLVLRGLKTLAIRMERHCANARAVAEFLAQHPRVTDRALAGAPGASGPRDRRTADARLRRDGLVPRRDGGRGCRARLAHDGVDARREPRRRREPHRAPCADDARLDRGRAVRGAAEPGAALGRARGCRRSRRRPRARARRHPRRA